MSPQPCDPGARSARPRPLKLAFCPTYFCAASQQVDRSTQLGRAALCRAAGVLTESAAPSSRRAPPASPSPSSDFRAERLHCNAGAIARDEMGSDPGRCSPHSADTPMFVKNRSPRATRFPKRLAQRRRRRRDTRLRTWSHPIHRVLRREPPSRRPLADPMNTGEHAANGDFAKWPRFEAMPVRLALAGTSNGGGPLGNRSGTCYTWRGRPVRPVAVQPNAKRSDFVCNQGKGERGKMEKADGYGSGLLSLGNRSFPRFPFFSLPSALSTFDFGVPGVERSEPPVR